MHHQFALAEEGIHDQSVAVLPLAEDDHRQLMAHGLGLAAIQHLLRCEQTHGLVAKLEMMTPLQRFDFLARQFQRSGDLREWNSIRLTRDLDQQGAQDRERQRQLELEPRSPTWLRAGPNGPAHVLDHVLHYVQTDAAAGNLGHVSLQCEPGQEQELKQFGLGELLRHRGQGKFLLHNGSAHAFRVHAGAIVGDRDEQHSGTMPGFQLDHPLGRLSRAAALLRRFAAVIDRVSQQVRQRRFQALQDVAVHLRVLAGDFQPRLLAQRARQIAHHARKSRNAIPKRPHPGPQHFQVKTV